jgi:hypothetical protein
MMEIVIVLTLYFKSYFSFGKICVVLARKQKEIIIMAWMVVINVAGYIKEGHADGL